MSTLPTRSTAIGKGAADGPMPINLLVGLPDDMKGILKIQEDGRRLDVLLGGSASLAPHLSRRRFAITTTYLHPSAEVSLRLGPGPLLNHVADPDICSGSLAVIERVVREARRPCFNHPAAVARTGRDEVARLLAGTPGLDVPKTIRVRAATPKDVFAEIERHGLAFPVLVRVPGAHGGKKMARIAGPQDSGEILNLRSRSLYVTEFRDFAGPDGLYRKWRIVVVGGEIFLRHHIIADSWLVNRSRRADANDDEETAMLGAFGTDWAPRLRPTFQEIARRLDLDYFGVDCSIDASGRIILFEANPTMLVLVNTRPSPNAWDKPIARIAEAIENLLATPSRWRDFPRYAAQKGGAASGTADRSAG